MAEKARHAFGALENVDSAISSGKIDSFDILFVKDANGKPYVGWVDSQGQKVIVDNKTDLSGIEAELATKVGADEVNTKVSQAIVDSVASAKAYTDKMVEVAVNEHMVKKFEITSIPEGTLVDYRDKEIRVMCPADIKWVKQNVGSAGNANMYYMGFKAYAPDGAVSFKEGDRGVIIDEMFDFNDDFAGTDEYGRNFSICWLALASYNEAADAWTYFGKNSNEEKFIGWDYIASLALIKHF